MLMRNCRAFLRARPRLRASCSTPNLQCSAALSQARLLATRDYHLFRHLLSSLSQLVTLPFQSQVCFSRSNASPDGQVICLRPDLVHLR